MTGLPRSSGWSRCSMLAKQASRSRWAITRIRGDVANVSARQPAELRPRWRSGVICGMLSAMTEVAVDKSANLLKVTYAGKVGAEEAQKSKVEIVALLDQLQTGFILLT